jgi:hypothetical protein
MSGSVTRIARDGWKFTGWAVIAMPVLAVTALAGIVLCNIVFTQVLDLPWSATSLAGILQNAVRSCVETLLLASVAMGVHRLVILGDAADRPIWKLPTNYLRFAVWLVFLNVLLNLPASLVRLLLSPTHPAVSFVCFAYQMACIFVVARLSLLFPALAVAAPHAWWRNAWRDSRGHFWRFFITQFTASLPLIVLVLIVGIVFWPDLRRGSWPVSVGFGAVAVMFVYIGAVVASRFFQIYGASLDDSSRSSAG